MTKIVITKSGELLKTPVGFDPGPEKGEAPSGELEASETDKPCKETFDSSIVSRYRPSDKEFSTAQAQFARRGYELKSKQHPAGLTLFDVTRHGQTRVFSHFGDVGAFLTQLQQGGGRA